MTSYLRFGILSSLLLPVWVHQAYFCPGTTTSFDFFDINPDLKTYGLYVKYCVEQQCDLSVFHNFRQAVPTASSSTFKVRAATHDGSYTLSVKSADIGFIIPHILNMTAAYLCMQKTDEYLSRKLPPVYKRGRTVVVPCPVIGFPLPTVTWSKRAGGSVVEIMSDNDKYIITQLGHLFISDFSDSDVGFYSCSAKNDCGKRCFADSECSKISAQGADYELRIQDEDEKPTDKLIYYFLNPNEYVDCWSDDCFYYSRMYNNVYMYIKPNDNVHIEVHADMHSKSRYVGYKMLTYETSPRYISYSDEVCYGVLQNYTNKDVQLNSVDCGAYDTYGMMSPSTAKYNVAITEPPHIDLISSQNIEAYGSDFSIEFKITKGHNDDLPGTINVIEVTCFKNSELFLMKKGWHKQCMLNKTTNIVTITIICATDTDTGYYQVMAKNWSGSNISHPTYVETYPGGGSSRNCFPLRHTVLSSRSVRLEWERPNSNLTTPLIYEIVLKNLAWKEELDRSHTEKLTAVIEELHPGISYHVHVQSNSDLVGHRVLFKTHEERPSAPPANVNCEPQEGSTSIYCVWDGIPLQQRNGDITSYKVKYRLQYDQWLFNFTSVEYIHLDDLEPRAQYTVQVMGCTAVGCGSHLELNVKTLEDRPNYRPTLRYTITGAKNIRMGWDRPPGSFKIIFYEVNCKEHDTGTRIFSKNTTNVDVVISGQSIKPDTKYLVSVTPESSQGFGPTLTKEVSTLSSGSFSIRSSFLLIFLSILIVLIFIDF